MALRLSSFALLITIFAPIFCGVAAAQYTPSGTAEAWTGYNTDFLRTDSSGNHFFANAQSGTSAAGFWLQSNEIAMAVDAYNWAVKNDTANLPNYVAEINSLCAGFVDAHGHSWASDLFNDDLNWATMAFARAYVATGTTSQLTDAITNFNTVWSRAQSPAGSGNGLAGLIQVQPPTTPNLDSPVNFTFVIAGYMLYNITGTATYKSEADNVYTWSMANLYQPTIEGGVCKGHATLTCSKIYDANSVSVGGTTGAADYTYNYGIAIQAIILEGNNAVAQNVANWLMYNSNNTNDPYVGTYTLNGTAYNVLPNYQQGGVNGAGYNGIAMRGIGFGLAQGALDATTLAWAQANASAIWSIRNGIGISWNSWLTQTPLTGLYSWDDSASMATLFDIPSSSVAVTVPSTANTSQGTTLTAAVTPAVTTTQATGTVQFYANGKAIGLPAAVNGNLASLPYTFAAAGANTITAVYSGDANYTASTSQPATLTVVGGAFTITPGTPTYTLISGATTGNTDAITITSSNGFAGSVALSCMLTTSSGTAAGSCSLSPSSVTLPGNGSAASTLNIVTTPGTSGALGIVVSGVGNGVTASASALVVNLTASSFTLTPSPATVTLPAGGSGSSTVTLASVNGFAGPVALTCSATGTAASTCSFSPSSVTLTAGGTTTSTVTIGAGTAGALTANIAASGTTAGASLAASATATIAATVVTPSFTMSAAPTSLSFTSGAASGNTAVVTVTSVNYFASAVALTCTLTSSTAAFQPSCTATPATVTPAANGTATSTITVSSTTAQAANILPLWPVGPTVTLALALLFPLRRRRFLSLFAAVLVACSLAALSGCGDAATKPTSPPTPLRSSAGTYTLTVTAASGSSTQSSTVAVNIN